MTAHARTVCLNQALHARPVDRLVQLARSFDAEISLVHGAKRSSARSAVQLLLLGAGAGSLVGVSAVGPDAEQALASVVALLEAKETPSASGPDQSGPGATSAPLAKSRGEGASVPGAASSALPTKGGVVLPAPGQLAEGHIAGEAGGGRGVIVGQPAAPGVAIGVAQREQHGRHPSSRLRWTAAGELERERRRLSAALAAASAATLELLGDDDPFLDVFRGQYALLEDTELRSSLERHVEEGLTAVGAVLEQFVRLERHFSELGSAFARERHSDVADVRDRLLEKLDAVAAPAEEGSADRACLAPEGRSARKRRILIVQEATPSRLLRLDATLYAAVISQRGGPTSHAAIVARGRGIPLVVAPAAALEPIEEGTWLRLDGRSGRIELLGAGAGERGPDRDRDILQRCHLALAADVTGDSIGSRAARAGLVSAEPKLPGTSGGRGAGTSAAVVRIRANIGGPGDLAAARLVGAEGCGLLRTELLFASRTRSPDVAEQADAYLRIARPLAPHPLVIRLFDAGSDKPLAFLPVAAGEPNPALGLRGVRLLLAEPGLLRQQLEAIASARERSGLDIRALVPMVADASEVERVLALAPDGLPVGAMIETPAAALCARAICGKAAFVSLGTNDLAQYTLARDRAGTEGNALHPAVLRLACEVAAVAAERGLECSACGELAADPRAAQILVGLGVRALSVAPAAIPGLRQALASISPAELARLARRALEFEDPNALAGLLGACGERED